MTRDRTYASRESAVKALILSDASWTELLAALRDTPRGEALLEPAVGRTPSAAELHRLARARETPEVFVRVLPRCSCGCANGLRRPRRRRRRSAMHCTS
jgi:hypothetical protein